MKSSPLRDLRRDGQVSGCQDAIESGLAPEDFWSAEVEPALADFVAPVFEELCRRYVRRRFGTEAPQVGAWWGNALNRLRRDGRRTSEEVDVVAAHRNRLRLVGECKWTSRPMPLEVLTDLQEYKLPAIAEEGRLKVPGGSGPKVLLFSRSGFDPSLRAAAAEAAGAAAEAADAEAPPEAPIELLGPDEVTH